MNITDLAVALENAFPHINFKTGPELAVDSRGAVYISYMLGRVQTVGESGPVMLNSTEEQITRLFYLDLHDVISKRQPKFIEWRRQPVLTRDDYIATMVPHALGPREGLVVSCRFSMRMSP